MFTTEIHVSVPLDDQNGKWRTIEPLHFWSEKFHKHYIVPKDFESDLASVPRLPVIYLRAGGRGSAAAIVHDWLYANGVKFQQIESREEADEVFLEALLATNVDPTIANEMFFAVRAFGAERFAES